MLESLKRLIVELDLKDKIYLIVLISVLFTNDTKKTKANKTKQIWPNKTKFRPSKMNFNQTKVKPNQICWKLDNS